MGQETNGTYGGMNASSFIDLTLPHSKIVVHTPLVKNYLEVRPIQPLERGVLPDYLVDFSLEDVLARNDVQLELVKNLIQKNTDDTP